MKILSNKTFVDTREPNLKFFMDKSRLEDAQMPPERTLLDAIVLGKKIHADLPKLGSENDLIKLEVAAWIWKQFETFKPDEKDADLRFLMFIQKITD